MRMVSSGILKSNNGGNEKCIVKSLPPFCYVVSAVVDDVDQADGMGAVTDDWGFEWYYTDRPDLYDGQRVTIVYDCMGTPDDLKDDEIVDIFGACPEGSPCHED